MPRIPQIWPGRSNPERSKKISQPLTGSSTSLDVFHRNTESNHSAGSAFSSEGPSLTTQSNNTNIIIFGETGAGKSSVINLIAGENVAQVASDVNGCTMDSTPYRISMDGMNFTIFDTVGLETPEMGINGYLKTIEKAFELIIKLEATGGVHLLLFCVRGGRITATTQSNYRMFYECLCREQVPIVLLFTGLEREMNMEDWWTRNRTIMEHYGISSSGHACITAVRGDTPDDFLKFIESQKKTRQLVKTLCLKNAAALPKLHHWLARFAQGLISLLQKGSVPDKKKVMKVLIRRCHLAPDVAQKIIEMMEKTGRETEEDQNIEQAGDKRSKGDLAASGYDKEITVNTENHITEPDIQISDHIRKSWANDQLDEAETSMSDVINRSRDQDGSLLASRALIRIRLGKWDAAIQDAEQSIDIRQSVIGYISKSVAFVCKGERDKGYQMCNLAFQHASPAHRNFVVLIKAVITFMAKEYYEAIAQLDTLTSATASPGNSICYVVQAYMYFLRGSSEMENALYEDAVESFQRAQHQAQAYHFGGDLTLISLIFGWKFDHLKTTVSQHYGEALCAARPNTGQVADTGLESRCCAKLEKFGDVALGAQRHNVANIHYSTALSLSPRRSQDIFIKRSKVRARMGKRFFDDALEDAKMAIDQDPSSPWGYEAKYWVLLCQENYHAAEQVFDETLSRMKESPDPTIRACRDQYNDTRTAIRKIVHRIARRLPRVLINTSTGRLQNKVDVGPIFESSPLFRDIFLSVVKNFDLIRIRREVKQFFQYVMLSHKWDDDEPSFQQVMHMTVYDLDESPTHNKLKLFCKVAQDSGFNWAWSDTCCIDQRDNSILQEALVAMFKWYHGAAMVIVYLFDVPSPGVQGDLVKSIWNTRAWTFQEYLAAKVIHFYTKDWKLYRSLRIANHKELPEIIEEMEKASQVSAQQLITLYPGISNIREKLRLASSREATKVEDMAYSLFGIFAVTGIQPNYGEEEDALGRLLAHILSSSGDVSILAWQGYSSRVNSCLPAYITVYSQLEAPYFPRRIEDVDVEKTGAGLLHRTVRHLGLHQTQTYNSIVTWLQLDPARRLYNLLHKLPTVWFTGTRMRLPCISFRLPPLQARQGRLYHSESPTFGTVEVETRQDLSRLKSLYLVHPWIDALLGREHRADAIERPPSLNSDDEDDNDDIPPPSRSERPLRSAPLPDLAPLDEETRVLQLIARLRQPFGGLLLALTSTNGREEYERVATDAFITVQIQETVSLEEVINHVRTLDVL